MYVTVFTADPTAAYKLWHDAHKPCVRVAVCSTGLATHLTRKIELEAQTSCGTAIDDTL